MSKVAHYSEFTENGYRLLLQSARDRYRFLSFREAATAETGILWRHDIDVSVHRALALAKIEHAEGVRATYFVYLHSRFYHALEDAVVDRLKAIADLGHEIGLHFDEGFTPRAGTNLAAAVAAEAAVVEWISGVSTVAVSFHDPGANGAQVNDDDEIAGRVNAYGRSLQRRFGYTSDSNGYWRFVPAGDEICSGRHPRLQVLTHPEWWVPQPLAPRDRIARAIEGRAVFMAAKYDAVLAQLGRRNLR